jgi:hypothetical protein
MSSVQWFSSSSPLDMAACSLGAASENSCMSRLCGRLCSEALHKLSLTAGLCVVTQSLIALVGASSLSKSLTTKEPATHFQQVWSLLTQCCQGSLCAMSCAVLSCLLAHFSKHLTTSLLPKCVAFTPQEMDQPAHPLGSIAVLLF